VFQDGAILAMLLLLVHQQRYMDLGVVSLSSWKFASPESASEYDIEILTDRLFYAVPLEERPVFGGSREW